MAHENKVMRSINDADGCRCVDIVLRRDGTYGFEEYRREPEEGRGWFVTGFFGGEAFPSFEAALSAAQSRVAWLARPD